MEKNCQEAPFDVSVVLCVKDERARIESFLSQSWLAEFTEVIVVDGGSTDGTRDLVRRLLPEACLLSAGKVGLLRQRLLGIAKATCQSVLMVNVDDALSAATVDQLVRSGIPRGVDGIQLSIRAMGVGFWSRAWTQYFRIAMPEGKLVSLLGVPALARKSLFQDVYPPDGILHEDTWLREHVYRGSRLLVSDLFAFRECPNSLAQNLEKFICYGQADFALGKAGVNTISLFFHTAVRILLWRSVSMFFRGEIPGATLSFLHGLLRTTAHLFESMKAIFKRNAGRSIDDGS